MAQPRRKPVRERDLKGLKYFRVLLPLVDRLHADATARDRAGKRSLFFDHYACLLLLFFFSPIIQSVRGLQQASTLSKVQKLFGCERASLGSLSEAGRVFDPALLQAIIGELAAQAQPLLHGREAEALRGLEAVDGSLLPALPKMAWALWQDDLHRAAKMHVHFDVIKWVPTHVSVTSGNASERQQLRERLRPGGFYVFDRGYVDYDLFQDILAVGASFVGRLRDNAVYDVAEERPWTDADRAAGVVRDVVIDKLGIDQRNNTLEQPLRIVTVTTGKLADGSPDLMLVCSNRLDLSAELVALAYRFRWVIELFFRWFKCVLGCRHLLSTSANGVTIQVYLGIIASLLISLWVGKKPTLRTLEMLQFYFAGWATEEELVAHIAHLKDHI